MIRFIKYQLPLLLYAGLIFTISSIPQLPKTGLEFEFFDKLAHLLEYAILAILAVRALSNLSVTISRRFTYIITAIFSIAYAISDELHQSLIPGRSCDFYDIIADVVGIFLAIFAHVLLRRRQDRQSQSATRE